MARVIDLDLLQPIDLEFTVTVAGEQLKLRAPGDLPIPTVIRLMQLRKELGDAGEAEVKDLLGRLLAEINAVIRQAMPELDADVPFTGRQLGAVLAVLLGGAPEDTPEDAVVDAIMDLLTCGRWPA